MLSVVVVVLALVAVVCICLLVQEALRRRTPAELRGDWWTSFEREFRAYASEATRSTRTKSRRRDQPGPRS
jgi:hypothetical protein